MTYLNSALEYIKFQQLMLQDDDLRDIYSYDDFYKNLDSPKKKNYHFYNMTLMLFEVVYLAHTRKWISKEEWDGWNAWMSWMMSIKEFRDVLEIDKVFYSKEFGNYLYNLTKDN